MAWVRIDDAMPLHPKVLALCPEDRWRFLEVLCYCSRYRTDGRVEGRELVAIWSANRLREGRRRAARLVAAGLLDECPDEGPDVWRVHDYLEYQISREADDERRLRHRERQAAYEQRRRQREAKPADPDASVTRPRARVDPTRPPRKGGGEGGDTTSRGRPPAAPRRAARSSSPARSSDLRAISEVIGSSPNGHALEQAAAGSRTLEQVLTIRKARAAAARGGTT